MNNMIFNDLPFFQSDSGGGGSTVNVDQHFNPDSTYAQSGTAVAEAISDRATTTYVDNADNNLQQQIDALASSSDVVDVVGTYAELQAYDTTHLKNNDIVKVLQDETKDDAITYYRWVIDQQTHTGSWEYIGQSGPYYTKSETQEYVSSATANFITAAANNLINYYLKSEIYTKNEVQNLIGQIQTAHFEVVQELPQTGESNVIYLILRSDPETSNIYDEYIYINSAYEKIGSTDVDLTGYATESWVNIQIANFLTQTQIQSLINTALTNYYTKSETDGLLENKLTEPSSGLAVGKYFRVASIDADGHAVLECVDLPEQIFVATYGVTTYSEIAEAINAGKEIICWYDFRLYRCTEDAAGAAYHFTCADEDTIYQITVLKSNKEWYNSKTQLVKEKNLNYSITTLMTTESSETIWSDTQKNGCYNRTTIRKTTLDSVLVPNANYDLYHFDTNNRTIHFPAGYDNYQVIVYKGGALSAGTYRFTVDENAVGGVTSSVALYVNEGYNTSVEKTSDTLTGTSRVVEFTLYSTKDSFLLMIGNYGIGNSMNTYYQNPSMYKIVNGEPTGDDLIQKFTTDNVVFTTGANRVNAQVGKWTTLNWASGYIKFDIFPTTFEFSLPTPSGSDNYSNNEIYVAFRNGSDPSTINITSSTYVGDTSYSPVANSISELKFRYVCDTWVLNADSIST